MREILFKGKLSHSKGWVVGNLILSKNWNSYIIPSNILEEDGHHLKIDSDLPYWVDEGTVGQYTGIKDKNNTKIFEDDVLRITIKEEEDSVEYKLGVVKFSKERLEYIVTTKEEIEYTFGTMLQNAGFYKFEFEVIGNIHDNPKLIK